MLSSAILRCKSNITTILSIHKVNIEYSFQIWQSNLEIYYNTQAAHLLHIFLGSDLALVETVFDGAVEWPLVIDKGTYMELVDREVIGNPKKLLVDTVWGVLGAKIEYITV